MRKPALSRKSRPRSGRWAPLAAAAFGLLVAIAAVEILPRLLPDLMPGRVRTVVRLYEARSTWEDMMRADAELGFTLKSGLDIDFPSEGRSVHVRTVASGVDDIGMRDLGTEAPFSALAVGDSFTFCDDSPAEECWVKLLAERTGMSIASLGVNGYSNLAAARLLRKVSDAFEPKLVMVGFFPNDFKDNLHFDNWTKSGTQDYWTWMRRKRRSDASEFLARTSVLYRLIDAARRYGKRDTHVYEQDGLSFTFRSDAWWRAVVQDPGRTRGFELMTEALTDIHAHAESSGAKLLVLLFPFKEQVYWHIAERYQPEGQHFTQEEVDAPMEAVAAFCEERGIECCDLTEPLRARARRGEQLYLKVSAHWNAQGNAAAADVVRGCLTERGLLESPHARRAGLSRGQDPNGAS